MRIKEVIEKTGLSRRTIQFYISQKLIMPKEDPVNGYHDFSNEDVRNLIKMCIRDRAIIAIIMIIKR